MRNSLIIKCDFEKEPHRNIKERVKIYFANTSAKFLLLIVLTKIIRFHLDTKIILEEHLGNCSFDRDGKEYFEQD